MNRHPRLRPSFAVFATCAVLTALLCASPRARGQDDYDVPDEVAPDPNAMMGNVVMMQQNNVEMFDQWVFNQVGGAGQARNRMTSRLSLKLDEVGRVCGLSEAQKKKLDLAGKGDVKRFFDLVDETRRKYQKMPNNQNNNIWNDIQPLQAKYMAGLYDQGSLFMKTLHGSLTSEQSEKYQAVELKHRREHHEATIDWFIAHLDKGVGLSSDQSHRLSKLMHQHSRTPKRFGQGDYYFMLFQASKIPEADLKAVFDDVQWKIVSPQIQQGRQMEQWLKTQGVIDGEPVVVKKAVAAIPAMRLVPAAKAKEVDKKAHDAKKSDDKPAAQ